MLYTIISHVTLDSTSTHTRRLSKYTTVHFSPPGVSSRLEFPTKTTVFCPHALKHLSHASPVLKPHTSCCPPSIHTCTFSPTTRQLYLNIKQADFSSSFSPHQNNIGRFSSRTLIFTHLAMLSICGYGYAIARTEIGEGRKWDWREKEEKPETYCNISMMIERSRSGAIFFLLGAGPHGIIFVPRFFLLLFP